MKNPNAIQELVDQLNSQEPEPVPPHFASLEAMLDHSFEFAKGIIMGTDDSPDESAFMPMWGMVTEKGQSVLVATPFDNGERGKEMVAEGMRLFMQEAHVMRYTFTSEAWVATQTKRPTEFDLPPSERTDRKEILMIVGGDRIAGDACRVYEIVRDADDKVVDIKFEKDLSADGGKMEGRFSGLLEVARQ